MITVSLWLCFRVDNCVDSRQPR